MFQQKRHSFGWSDINDHLDKLFATLIQKTYEDCRPTIIIYFFQLIVAAVFEFSLMFDSGLLLFWNTPQTNSIVQLVQAFEDMTSIAKPISTIAFLGVAALILLFICLWGAILLGAVSKKPALIAAVQFARVTKLLTVPIVRILFWSYGSGASRAQPYFALVGPILFIFMVAVEFVYIKFYFSPLREGNLFYRYGSSTQLYSYVLLLARAVVVCVYGLDLWVLVVSLCVPVVMAACSSGCHNPLIKAIDTLTERLIAATAFVALVHYFYVQSRYTFGLWLSLLLSLSFQALAVVAMEYFSSRVDFFECCRSISEDKLMNFIQRFRSLKESKQCQEYLRVFSDCHLKSCQVDDCQFRRVIQHDEEESKSSSVDQSSVLYLQVEQFILNFLKRGSLRNQFYGTLLVVLLYENKKPQEAVNLQRSVYRRDFIYCRNFILYLVKSQQEKGDSKITDDNFVESRMNFFRHTRNTVEQIGRFFDQLKQKQARLTVLEATGYQSHQMITEMKRLFAQLIREKIDYNIVEIYLQFCSNLLREKSHCQEVVTQIKRKARLVTESHEVNESCQPALEICRRNGARILQVNAETQKLFGLHRIELLDKDLFSFIQPKISPDYYEEVVRGLLTEEKTCFIRNSRNGIAPVRIHALSKYPAEKKRPCCIKLFQVACSSRNIMLLLDEQGNLLASSIQQICLRPLEGTYSMSDFYEREVRHHLNEFASNIGQYLDIPYDNRLTVRVSYGRTLLSSHKLLFVRISKRVEVPAYTQKAVLNELEFRLSITGKPTFKGAVQNRLYRSGWAVVPSQNNNLVVSEARARFDAGIKLYRLVGDRLYNIELEEASIASSEKSGSKVPLSAKSQQTPRRKVLTAILCSMWIICIVLLAASIIQFSRKSANKQLLDRLYQQQSDSNLLQLRLFRMVGILIDADSNTTSASLPWRQQLLDIFNEVQQRELTKLFRSFNITFNLNGEQLTTDLDGMCSRILSLLYNIGRGDSLQVSKEIEQLASTTLLDQLLKQKAKRQTTMASEAMSSFWMDCYVELAMLVLLAVMLGLQFLLIRHQVEYKKEVLRDFCYLGDLEIHAVKDRLERFAYVLQLCQKSEDNEAFGVLEASGSFEQRESPKQINTQTSVCTKMIAIPAVILVVNIAVFYFLLNQQLLYSAQLSQVLDVTSAITTAYTGLLELAIQLHGGILNQQLLQKVKQSVLIVEANRFVLPFSQSFSAFVNQVFFGSTCDWLVQWIPTIDCSNYLADSSIADPFAEGMSYYLSSLYYSLNAGFSQVQPVVGYKGTPFYIIFRQLVSSCLAEWKLSTASVSMYICFFYGLLLSGVVGCLVWMATRNNTAMIEQMKKIRESIAIRDREPDPNKKSPAKREKPQKLSEQKDTLQAASQHSLLP